MSQPQQGYNQPDWNNPPQYQPNYNNNNYYQQQQNYDQEAGNANNDYGPPPPINYATKPNESGETFEERFKVSKPKWNDIPFTILFLAVLGGYIALAVITIRAYSITHWFQGDGIYSDANAFTLNTSTIILFVFTISVSVVLAFIYFALARIFTKFFIYFSFIMSIIVGLATAIYYLAVGYYSAGIVFLIFSVLQILFFWSARSRIPFATLVLQIVIDATRVVPSIYFVSFFGAIAITAFAIFFAISMVSAYVKFSPNSNNPGCDVSAGSCSNGKLIGSLIYITFAGFYISEVIKNVTHVTISGAYGTWYYCYKSDQGMPKWPAFGSFKRAMTYSFGSISFGSLLISIVNLIRYLLEIVRSAQMQSGEGGIAALFITICLCCVDCFLSLIQWLITYFNHYAYTVVALYGKAYIPAAKDTWTIIRARGIDALINDCLIDKVLSLGVLLISYVAALFSYLYLRYTNPPYNRGGGYYPIVIGFTMVIALQIGNIVTVAIRAGTATFFVALARDPDVFRMSYPTLYDELLRAYPAVREKLGQAY
ncbi:hypothetical protein D0Z03_000068 [Geotrichum reessii]|nr:hypothetical protein D0Z03_000068 [Galactomyces reessii]